MPSESLRFETLEALKNSPKGKLTYRTDSPAGGEDVWGCAEVCSLSSLSGHVLKRLSPSAVVRTSSLASSSPSTRDVCPAAARLSPLLSPVSPRTTPPPAESPQKSADGHQKAAESQQTAADSHQKSADSHQTTEDMVDVASPPATTISVLSPRATVTAGCIRMYEQKHRARAKMELTQRQEQQERLANLVAARESEQLKRYEELMELKQRQECQSMKDTMEKATQEIQGRQEKLREEHRHRNKILNLRLREMEQQRQREAELERQRLWEGRERLKTLNDIQGQLLQLNQLLQPAPPTSLEPSADRAFYITRGNQLCSQVSELARASTENQFLSTDEMATAQQALEEMKSLVRALQEAQAQADEVRKKKELEEEEEKKRQAELKVQHEEQMKNSSTVALSAKQTAKKCGLQTSADNSTLNWYRGLQDSANQCAEAFQVLNSARDDQVKKLRMELLKSVTTAVNQISGGLQLKELFDKLDKLLSGRPLTSAGRTFSSSQHPQGREFVSYKLAEKFVKQGEEEVASNHSAAFPIGAVVVGIWEVYPNIGELLLAHLHKKCPYAVPHYPPLEKGMSEEEYLKVLGYRNTEDCKMEKQDIFLKRISGMIRLYAAILQLRWPFSNKSMPHPHGLSHGWRWLAQILNMEPISDITATILFDFLEVCGNALLVQYQGQFWKLMLLINEEFLPRIEAVTSSFQMGSVSRLKGFLEQSIRTKRIPLPKTELGSNFFRC